MPCSRAKYKILWVGTAKWKYQLNSHIKHQSCTKKDGDLLLVKLQMPFTNWFYKPKAICSKEFEFQACNFHTFWQSKWSNNWKCQIPGNVERICTANTFLVLMQKETQTSQIFTPNVISFKCLHCIYSIRTFRAALIISNLVL